MLKTDKFTYSPVPMYGRIKEEIDTFNTRITEIIAVF